jgi:hypothetical protein
MAELAGVCLPSAGTEDMTSAARGGCHVFVPCASHARAIGTEIKGNDVHYGMSRRQAEKAARKMGVAVSAARKTGETKFVFADGRQMKTNARRKDASKAIVKALLDEMR